MLPPLLISLKISPVELSASVVSIVRARVSRVSGAGGRIGGISRGRFASAGSLPCYLLGLDAGQSGLHVTHVTLVTRIPLPLPSFEVGRTVFWLCFLSNVEPSTKLLGRDFKGMAAAGQDVFCTVRQFFSSTLGKLFVGPELTFL